MTYRGTFWIIAVAACLLLAGPISHAANIVINSLDGAGEGFNDTTPVSPVGGNPGTTLGQQRLNAFQRAAEIWGSAIQSSVTIIVDASLDPLSCTASSATLGAAGTNFVFRDFPNAPVANTWYHSALANALAGQDLQPSESDIVATFNSSIDNNNNCLAGLNWYLGYDNNPGAGISLLDVLLHEFAHGLGFSGFVNLNTGQFLNGFQDVFSLNTLDNSSGLHWDDMRRNQRRNSAKNTGNVVWDGAQVRAAASGALSSGQDSAGNVKLYTPNPLETGSSVYHFDTSVSPNVLMEPDLNAGLGGELDLTDEQMLDVGWSRPAANGDVNGDGKVDIADLLLLQDALAGGTALTTGQQQRADLHPAGGNGQLNIGDLLALQELLAP